eukprot:sb/3464312/
MAAAATPGSMMDKSFQLQLQMKQNTEEMSSFLKDMTDWTKEVKQKDKELITSADSKPSEVLPPIRCQPKPRKKKKKTGAAITDQDNKSGSSKIRGNDYRAWDKFDVDAAIKEIDGGKNQQQSDDEGMDQWDESDASTDNEMLDKQEEERKQMQAVYLKEKGNDFFKQGKWEDAVECYTKGLQCDALNAVLFANRAMALIKLQKYAAAIADCDCSIELDDGYTKAYLRRATAHLKLEHKEEALADFRKVLEFEPENKLALGTVRKLEVELAPPVEYKPRKEGDITHMRRTLPPSDKPMVRIQIHDIRNDEYDIRPASRTPAKSVPETPTNVKFETLPTRIPANYLQFQTDFRKLRTNPEALFKYIKQIDPDIYPKLFQDSLEADQLFIILDILNKFYVPAKLPVYNELHYLTKVKRFDMAVMFKTEAQQLTISQLVHYAAENASCKVGILKLVKAYDIMDLSKYELPDITDEVETTS